jgi:hypothetical protein
MVVQRNIAVLKGVKIVFDLMNIKKTTLESLILFNDSFVLS